MNPRLLRTCQVQNCERGVWSRELCRKHYYRWHKYGDPNLLRFAQSPAGAPRAFLDALPSSGTGCVPWPFATNNMGYAQINIEGRKFLTSRVVCEREHGPAPSPTHVAAHECGKGHEACVAPWHLVWKTPAENMADRVRHGTMILGQASVNAKLTEADVLEIVRLSGMVSQSSMAERFGVSQTMISHIVTGKAWTHLTGVRRAA